MVDEVKKSDVVAPDVMKAGAVKEDAVSTVQSANAKVVEAQAKADAADKSKEQIAVEKAAKDADDAKAKAYADGKIDAAAMSVVDAKVMAPVAGDMSAGDHMAQKFGNDPANPKPAANLSSVDEAALVLLSRKTPDHPDLVYTSVHPEMVGDYLRAGWNRD